MRENWSKKILFFAMAQRQFINIDVVLNSIWPFCSNDSKSALQLGQDRKDVAWRIRCQLTIEMIQEASRLEMIETGGTKGSGEGATGGFLVDRDPPVTK
jgi:hypothetical protein